MDHSCPSPTPDVPDPSSQPKDATPKRDQNQPQQRCNTLEEEAVASTFDESIRAEAMDLEAADQVDDIDRDTEVMGWNQLSSLGNHAIQRGLIIGHGFYKGKYEILKQGEPLLMSPDEALTYLQRLIREAE